MQAKKKTARRSLVVSAVALFLSVAMLIGTTFAWFTDSVTSGTNQITAGNLDIELLYQKKGEIGWTTVDDQTNVFQLVGDETTLWEPGHTEVAYLKVKNAGTLDLKYRIQALIADGSETTFTNVNDETKDLKQALVFSQVESLSEISQYQTREAAIAAAGETQGLTDYNKTATLNDGEAHYVALIVYMPTGIGNEFNPKTGEEPPHIDLRIKLDATQFTSESDSFDNQYDGGANVGGDLMQSASAVVTAPAQNAKLEIVLNNNAPVSDERSTTMTMEQTPEALAGKKVEFSATTYNASATQNVPNFSIATGNNTEVAALKLDLTVDGQPAAVDTERTVTTYIDTGLSDVKVRYVPTNGAAEVIDDNKVTYEPSTGKLTFTTTHFSDYVVTAKALKETDGVYEINNANDLFAFARLVNVNGKTFSGETVKLMADIDLTGKTWTPVGQTGGYSAKTYFQGTFDGNEKTIRNLNIPESTWEAGNDEGMNFATGFFGFIDQGGNTIKNVTFDHATVEGHHWVGVAAGYMTGTVSNVKVTNSTITSSYKTGEADGDKAGGVVGYLNSGSVTTGCTVTGSTITAIRDCGSVVGHSNGTVTGNTAQNCTVYYSTNDDTQIGGEIAGKRANGVDNNTATDVTVVKKLSTQDQLDSALGSGDNVEVILAAGEFELKNGIAQNKTVTIKGASDTIIDLGDKINYQHGATLTFEGVTLRGQSSGNYGGLAHVVKTTFNNCVINGKVTLYGEAEFNNCIFNNNADYSIWTWGAKNATFDGCTFNSGGKAILLYGGSDSTGTPTTVLTVNDCVFNDDDTLNTEKAAIEIGNDYNAAYKLSIKNITVNGFAPGKHTDSKIWANKDDMDTDHLNVVIDGENVF